MWLETGLDSDDVIEPPRYLYDEAVKSGINAMLMKDRAEEEEHQLQSEVKIMIKWLTSSLLAADTAASSCQGAVFCIILQPPAVNDLPTDLPLKYQLQMHRESLIQLASMWRSHILEVFPSVEWPSALLQAQTPPLESSNDDLDDDWIDLSDFGPIPDDKLELDDQHAAFLEDPPPTEEDELERLVTRIEGWSLK